MANLGSMYERGDGVEIDPVEAYAWLDAALMAGIPSQARDVIVYSMGAMSAHLKQEDLALAMKRAGEIIQAIRGTHNNRRAQSVHTDRPASCSADRAAAPLSGSHGHDDQTEREQRDA